MTDRPLNVLPVNDDPDARSEEFLAKFQSNPRVFAGPLEQAIKHRQTADVDAISTGWTPIGPRNVGGAIRCIAQHPTQPNRLFAGSAFGGLWRTDNGGYSWDPVETLPLGIPVGAVAIGESDSHTLYVGTGELSYSKISGMGLFRSLDDGATFENIAAPGDLDDAHHFGRIVVDPDNSTRAWVATDTGLWLFQGKSSSREGSGLPKTYTPLGAAAGTTALCRVSDIDLSAYSKDPTKWLLLCGVEQVGIFRALVPRDGSAYTWTKVWDATTHTTTTRRIRIAIHKPIVAAPTGQDAYAVMEEHLPTNALRLAAGHAGDYPTPVLRSSDWGANWAVPVGAAAPNPPPPFSATATPDDGQSHYSMAIAVVPDAPTTVLVGYVNLHISVDGGVTWDAPAAAGGASLPLLNWLRYFSGVTGDPAAVDIAQHGDQHNFLFDRSPQSRRAMWACNDGGISFAADVSLVRSDRSPSGWRKRSFGISSAQLNDITSHPEFPYIAGGGMQDNGTFWGYGGATWYRLDGGDGGSLCTVPGDPRRALTTTQETVSSISHTGIPPGFSSTSVERYRVTDQPTGPAVVAVNQSRLDFDAAFPQVFNGLQEAHAMFPAQVVIARKGGAYYTTDFAHANLLNLGSPFHQNTATPPQFDEEVTAIGSAANANDLWIGTSHGQLFFSSQALPTTPVQAGGTNVALNVPVGNAFSLVALPAPAAGFRILAIAVYRQNASVVAIAATNSAATRVYLSHDKGTTWSEIANTGDEIPSAIVSSLLFHPTDSRILYAGTLVGVYITRDLPAREAGSAALGALSPKWKVASNGLPFTLVTDISLTALKNTLRCATYGRGAYECSIPGLTTADFAVPGVRLHIGRFFTDDSYNYPAPNVIFDDPRLPPPAVPATDFDWLHAPDLRVDAPDLRRSEEFPLGDNIDGAEFDQVFVSDTPLVGDINHVYVQVHNRGSAVSGDATVHLYFANATSATTPPDIDSAALNFPNDPTAGSAWRRGGSVPIGVRPGEPLVARIEWIPPLTAGPNVALLAIVTSGTDAIGAIPSGPVVTFVRGERRAALRMVEMRRQSILIRDGLDDTGDRGGVAWGGRSPDIIVRQQPIAPPLTSNAALIDLGDAHTDDVAKGGANLVYVRVRNRTRLQLDQVHVRLFRLPRDATESSAGWLGNFEVSPSPGTGVQIGPIAAGDWGIAEIPVTINGDPDPVMSNAAKGVIFLAMASVSDSAGQVLEPFPQIADVTDVASFWRFFSSAPLATSAALRALRFQP